MSDQGTQLPTLEGEPAERLAAFLEWLTSDPFTPELRLEALELLMSDLNTQTAIDAAMAQAGSKPLRDTFGWIRSRPMPETKAELMAKAEAWLNVSSDEPTKTLEQLALEAPVNEAEERAQVVLARFRQHHAALLAGKSWCVLGYTEQELALAAMEDLKKVLQAGLLVPEIPPSTDVEKVSKIIAKSYSSRDDAKSKRNAFQRAARDAYTILGYERGRGASTASVTSVAALEEYVSLRGLGFPDGLALIEAYDAYYRRKGSPRCYVKDLFASIDDEYGRTPAADRLEKLASLLSQNGVRQGQPSGRPRTTTPETANF